MFKKFLAAMLSFIAVAAFAAVDANKATQAELESVKGIGPAIAGKILDERKKGNFKDWNDLVTRVQGVGEGNAAKFSEAGLTVSGAGFKGAAPAAAKKDDKPAAAAAKKDDKPAAAPAAAAKADPKADKEAAAKAKAEEKAKAKADKEAAAKKAKEEKDAAAKAKAEKKDDKKKDDKPAAKDDKAAAKPAAAAASGAKK
jgi:competence protein ComEA